MQQPKSRHYTAAGRQEAGRLITAPGSGVTAAARNFGSNTQMCGRWQRHREQPRNGVARGNGPLAAAPDALVRGRPAVKRLRLEGESVQNAALFFATASRGETPSVRRSSMAGRSRCGVRGGQVGAAGCMTTQSVRQPPPSVTQSATGWRVARREQKRRSTVMAGGAGATPLRRRGMMWGAARGVG
jgi:transposase-like protein